MNEDRAMSDPVGQASDSGVQHSSLEQSAISTEFADSLPDTFATWLEELRPALEPDQKVVAALPSDDNQPPGEVRFEGTLRVDCYLVGRLRSSTGTLVVSETGEVESDIVVAAAIIDGVMHGDIQASERVELQQHAKVFGNIESPTLVIQPGAVFEGQCRFLSAPLQSDNGDSDGADSQHPISPEAGASPPS
jgi:cytoskeletal protein CcmA (bactofilin family)